MGISVYCTEAVEASAIKVRIVGEAAYTAFIKYAAATVYACAVGFTWFEAGVATHTLSTIVKEGFAKWIAIAVEGSRCPYHCGICGKLTLKGNNFIKTLFEACVAEGGNALVVGEGKSGGIVGTAYFEVDAHAHYRCSVIVGEGCLKANFSGGGGGRVFGREGKLEDRGDE